MKIKNNKIIGIMFLIIFLIGFVNAAEFDLKINAQIDDFDADFYAQTDTGSSTGLDYLDSELRSYPSGNYSFLYSVASGYNFIIDSWPASSNPRTLNLVYETSPTNVAGTLTFSWNSISGYTSTLYDYGTDSSRTTLVDSKDMSSVSSYSVTHSSGTGKRYLKLIIDTATSVTSPGTGSGTGTTTPEVVCTPSCLSSSEVTCGQTTWSNGCDDGLDCSGFGTKCDVGTCSDITKTCITCSDTCESLGYECGTHTICGKTTNCNLCPLGETCNSLGKCVLTKECKDTCESLGYECGTHEICGVQQACGSCSNGKVCNSGQCGDGEPLIETLDPEELANILLNVPVVGKIGCSANPVCSDFGECSANYGVFNLISGSEVSGIRSRDCIDKNNCVANFVIKEPCILKQEVYTRNKVWCGKNYTEVIDATGKVLARLRPLAEGRAATIDFNLESEGYCPSCYDGIKNGDETQVDCGGSCISCDYKKEKLVWYKDPEVLLFVSLLLFLIFLISFSGVAVQTYRYYKERLKLYLMMRKYHHWKRQGYDAGVLHKDYHAIKKHYEVLKKRLN